MAGPSTDSGTPPPPAAKKPRTTDAERGRLEELMPQYRAEGWTAARLASEAGLSRSRVRTYMSNGGQTKRHDRPPFFTPA